MYEVNQNRLVEKAVGLRFLCPGFAKEWVNATLLSNSTVVFSDEELHVI